VVTGVTGRGLKEARAFQEGVQCWGYRSIQQYSPEQCYCSAVATSGNTSEQSEDCFYDLLVLIYCRYVVCAHLSRVGNLSQMGGSNNRRQS
jgi:hypothetical protein